MRQCWVWALLPLQVPAEAEQYQLRGELLLAGIYPAQVGWGDPQGWKSLRVTVLPAVPLNPLLPAGHAV